MSENNSQEKENKKNNKMKIALNNISCYLKTGCKKTGWFNSHIVTGTVGAIILLLLTIMVGRYFCINCSNTDESLQTKEAILKDDIKSVQKNCQESKKSIHELNESKKSVQCMDSVEWNFESKLKDSAFNSSMRTKLISNNRSDCFWLLIVYIIALCLIFLFYLIACSSRENRLLQFAIDWNEHEKEIKLKKIDKCKELKEIDKEKEIEKNTNKGKSDG